MFENRSFKDFSDVYKRDTGRKSVTDGRSFVLGIGHTFDSFQESEKVPVCGD